MQSRRLSLGLAVAGIAVAVPLHRPERRMSTPRHDRTHDHDRWPPKTTTTSTKIVFRNGAPVGGVREIEVAKGDPVRFDVTPDVPAEVHVHGYELTKEVEAGQTAKLDFPATPGGSVRDRSCISTVAA